MKVVRWVILLSFALAGQAPAQEVLVPLHPALPAPAQEARGLPKVQIHLADRARAPRPVVTVADIAEVSGGTTELRQRVGAIDLDDFTAAPHDSLRISRKQVAFRLCLAGIHPEVFQITGADSVQVTRSAQVLSEDEVTAAAREELQQRLPWPAEDVEIRPVLPARLAGVSLRPGDLVRLEASLAPTKKMLGRLRVQVAILVNGRREAVVPVDFEVQLFQSVAVALRRIEKGEPLTADNVRADRRSVDGATRHLTISEALTGRKAARTLLPGQVLLHEDVEEVAPLHPPLVKARDPVKMIARLGSIQVIANGVALQAGREGEWVNVRNTSSGMTVRGRVTAPGTVEVER